MQNEIVNDAATQNIVAAASPANNDEDNDDDEEVPRTQLPTPATESEPPTVKQEHHRAEREVIEIESSPEPEETEIKVESQVDAVPPTQPQPPPAVEQRIKRKRSDEQDEQGSSDDELKAQLKEIEAKEKLQELNVERLQLERKLAARKKR